MTCTIFVRNSLQKSGLSHVRLDGEPQGPDIPGRDRATCPHQSSESDVQRLPRTDVRAVHAANGVDRLRYWPISGHFRPLFCVVVDLNWTSCKYVVLYMVTASINSARIFLHF